MNAAALRQWFVNREVIELALRIWREHEWDASTRLCSCGEFFEAIGRNENGHPEHRMARVLTALVNRVADKNRGVL